MGGGEMWARGASMRNLARWLRFNSALRCWMRPRSPGTTISSCGSKREIAIWKRSRNCGSKSGKRPACGWNVCGGVGSSPYPADLLSAKYVRFGKDVYTPICQQSYDVVSTEDLKPVLCSIVRSIQNSVAHSGIGPKRLSATNSSTRRTPSLCPPAEPNPTLGRRPITTPLDLRPKERVIHNVVQNRRLAQQVFQIRSVQQP